MPANVLLTGNSTPIVTTLTVDQTRDLAVSVEPHRLIELPTTGGTAHVRAGHISAIAPAA